LLNSRISDSPCPDQLEVPRAVPIFKRFVLEFEVEMYLAVKDWRIDFVEQFVDETEGLAIRFGERITVVGFGIATFEL